MSLTLTAPIDEDYYRKFPSLPFPESYSGEGIIQVLNEAWAEIQRLTNNKLDITNITDEIVEHGTFDCNTKSSVLRINPKYFPIVSCSSVSYLDEGYWTTLNSDIVCSEYSVIVPKSPFLVGEFGLVKLSYTTGFNVIPEDLKMACAMVASHIMSGAFYPSNGSVGEGSLLPLWLPNDIQKILNKYTRFK